jgi:hypothetical protein
MEVCRIMIMIQLRPETERLLQEKAARQGQSLGAYIQQLAEREAHELGGAVPSAAEAISVEGWVARWRAWAEGHPASGVIADDSRESIYEGRGA